MSLCPFVAHRTSWHNASTGHLRHFCSHHPGPVLAGDGVPLSLGDEFQAAERFLSTGETPSLPSLPEGQVLEVFWKERSGKAKLRL